jgi:uncharacterized repeat protein (TIGR01451 family)
MFKKIFAVVASALTGVFLALAMVASAAAWHPEGQIKKYVQNVTAGGSLSDANTAGEAVQAKTGETLKYVIEIKNTGKPDSRGWNDMHYTVLRDTLPEGVELASDPSKREIVENIGVLKPGQKVTKSYDVRVTSDQNDTVITNKACFTGDSEVKDNKQAGCDNAVVKVFVPQTTSTVTEEPAPQVKGVTTLPATGAGGVIGAFAGVSSLGYAVHTIVTRKRK